MLLLIQYTLIFASVLALVALAAAGTQWCHQHRTEGIMVMGASASPAMKFVLADVPAIVMFY